ncbi:SacI homology domain-containing protein [Cokeromyces recurvatus]|uniref:SacI homology domain-containing protein n=1 Tax=Cokeromyces recurvatus TaxID=90255 RepID=UPI00221E9029|nr:SacI homology domain-containing protein [Cokeromyces recurvatus]KAI7907383.1 SacI homology domain-containing protein [Cokeromyces recurvatus]
MIYEQLELCITNETYHFTPLIEPAKKESSTMIHQLETLTVYRNSGEIQLNAPQIQNAKIEKEMIVYGILGFIRLQAGEYMIVITNCHRIGTLMHGADILRATAFQTLPLSRQDNYGLTNEQLDDEQRYIQLIENHLKQNNFYFSYKYPITLPIQKQLEMDNSWRHADTRFYWNRYLNEKLIAATVNSKIQRDFSSFILPVIQGFVSIIPTVINNRAVTFALISRRSQERAGTRYFSRGLDEFGFASNFVETEQLLFCDPSKSLVQTNSICASFIQTRGSIPAIWGQIPNTRYTPKLWMNADLNDDKVLNTSRLHFDQQIKHYGPQILVNLVNSKGYELPIGQLFATIVQKLANPNLKYIHFDFHRECCKMRWNRVQLLVDQLEPDLREQGYCLYNSMSEPKLKRRQISVVRTNCMDCLDRTNVVQSTLGRWVLNRQLREMGILQSTEVIENDEQFMQIFKIVWADNADALSVPYSGTGALKTDFTRTGKRTRLGLLHDFNNSVMRYIKNNYLDGSRQDGIDLILGKYKVMTSSHITSPFKSNGSFWIIKLIPFYCLASLALFFALLFSPNQYLFYFFGDSSLAYISMLSFSFTVFLTCWLFIQQNGTKFVDWPKLLPEAYNKMFNSNELLFSNHYNQSSNIVGTIQSKTNDLVHKWTTRRNSTAILNQVEQGYELMPPLKKTT